MTTTLITGANKGLGRETARRLLADDHTVWIAARDRVKPVAETGPEDVRRVFETNVFGVVRVTRAFLPVLEGSPNPVIVNVSSGMGSLAVTTDPARLESKLIGLSYPASKSALNMITSQYAKAYPQMRINAVDPGYTATDLNGQRGTKTVEEGAEVIVRMATLDSSGPTGAFVDLEGIVPW